MKLWASKPARPPQGLWLRRALFQVHLWTGLAFGLYIFVVSVSGSAIVFRHEMDHALCPEIILVKPSGQRLSDAQLAAAARRAGPRRFSPAGVQVEIRGPRVPGAAVEVWYQYRRGRVERLLDPYTGKDLGDATACEPAFVSRIADLHDNLLGGNVGRTVNGVGAVLVVLMGLSGAVIWWPGTSRWWRSVTLRWDVPWRRFIRDLHGVLGFWTFLLILMWAISAIYFAFPSLFYGVGDTSDSADDVIDWLVSLHFGRAFGIWVKVLWVVLGLVPAALILTGVLMWWNRVLRKALGCSGEGLYNPRAR